MAHQVASEQDRNLSSAGSRVRGRWLLGSKEGSLALYMLIDNRREGMRPAAYRCLQLAQEAPTGPACLSCSVSLLSRHHLAHQT
jgi:hypothetical protein